MFTRDPTSADPDRLVVESNFGLGESVVGGRGTPDRYVVRKSDGAVLERAIADKRAYWTRDRATGVDRITELSPERRRESSLTDAELGQVVDLGRRIEALFGCAEDVEFAVENGRVFIVQARPMTATGKRAASATTMGEVLVRGLGASPGSASGAVRIVTSPARGSELRAGEVLVARVTTPDWVPFMRRASALVTDGGGMTSHAAIVARELGLPCVVGTGSATTLLQDGVFVTVDGREGVVRRRAFAEPQKTTAAPSLRASPSPTATRLYVNLAEPSRAEEVAAMEVDGVGLLRAEFLLLEALGGVHPRLLIEREQGKGFVERVAEGTRRIARAFFPRPVIYRAMDFRTNEFRALEGGERFEPHEENPTIGYRGCFRYTREPDLFGLELEMVRTVRAELKNLHVMIPFVRTAWELERCLAQMNAAGLPLEPGFERWIMAEVPSVVHWMRAYARLGITGVSIGSNDLTQLVLGVDRDSAALAPFFDERDEAVLATIRQILRAAQRSGLATGICGQAPSVHPGYADRLVRLGIDGISVSPDAIDAARRNIASAEQRVMLSAARRSRRRA
jgi:pyruvate,water dikinase